MIRAGTQMIGGGLVFEHFISLGWTCATAASLAKNGFRDCSGPFDWYYSKLDGVLHLIDTDFSDFMVKENLEILPENAEQFMDKKNHLHFTHEVDMDFETEYINIYKKYMRRIERFRINIQKPTCFVRTVQNENEMQYIAENEDYIKRVIIRSNEQNQIVFLIPQWIKEQKISFPCFVLNIDEYRGYRREYLRDMLDDHDDFIQFLQSNISKEHIVSNLIWDSENEYEKMTQKYEILKYRYNTLLKLQSDNLNISVIPENIVIYGAGNIAKALFDKCRDICHIECFVDKKPTANEYKGIPILSLDKLDKIVSQNFIITPVYDMPKIENWFANHQYKFQLIPINSLFR